MLLFPFAFKKVWKERKQITSHLPYIFWVALTGISLFNTFLYIAAHTISAINLALIGTTSSPVFAILLAAIFLKEKISLLRMLGLLLCISGIVILITHGYPAKLLSLDFSRGDAWVLLAAFTFAVYNTLVKKKPASISSIPFLFSSFLLGSIILIPFFLIEQHNATPIKWNVHLLVIIFYLGAGASVIAYLCWNLAIGKLGSGRTALFGNLIPIFSTIEAVLILKEPFTRIHIISGMVIVAGLILANVKGAGALQVRKKVVHVN